MSFLQIDHVSKKFGETVVLHDVDITMEAGEFLVLVGPSGCGKSTLLNMIAGLEEVSTGSILINGRDITRLHPSERDIAMVFQSYALYPNMNVSDNIGFGLEMRKVPKPEREKAIQSVAKTLQIEHLLDRKPRQLSGGQRQRVAMGRALVRDPQVFLFDEPLSNLDAKLRVDMRTEIKRLHQAMSATIVYVTHDQIEAMTLATRIAVMNGGWVQQLGTPDQIYTDPTNTFVASFMGSPSMNLLDATAEVSGDQAELLVAQRVGEPLRLKLPHPPQSLQNGKVTLGLRPEHITDPESADRKSGSLQTLPCLVDVVEPTGADTFVVIELGGTETNCRMRSDIRLNVGQPTDITFNMGRAALFDPESGERIR
jgi:multiple sugar transport system ATP-binding protein